MISETNIPAGLMEAAHAFIESEVQPHIESYEVLVASLLEHDDKWIVGYQTRPALEGDWGKALAGNQPFEVVLGEDGHASTRFIELGEAEEEPLREIILNASGEVEEVIPSTE